MSILIKNATIVTQNEKREIKRADIFIEDDKISEISDKIKVSADHIIDGSGCAVLPGFINTHTHSAMTLFRGSVDDIQLEKFLEKTSKLDAKMTKESVEIGATLAAVEMIKSGTTSFVDLYYFEDAVAKAVQKAGIRGFLAWVTLDEKFTTQKGKPISNCENFIKTHKGKDLITPMVGLQGVYVCSEETLMKAKELADKNNTMMTMHLSETRGEVYEHQKKTDKYPPKFLDDIGFLADNFLAVHCVWMTVNDLNLLAKHNVKVAHCPISNMKLASGGVAPLPEMFERNMPVSLGTDSTASNNSLDLFSEMKVCGLLHKTHRWDASVLPAQKILDMATIDAAKALKMEKTLGSIEAGKKADMILINLKQPNMTPTRDNNIVSNIIYSCNSGNVDTVIINGKIVMEKRKMITVDEGEIVKKAELCAKGFFE
ncbi:MAG: amidohydrolase family protein [Thermoplasmata archaeon]